MKLVGGERYYGMSYPFGPEVGKWGRGDKVIERIYINKYRAWLEGEGESGLEEGETF